MFDIKQIEDGIIFHEIGTWYLARRWATIKFNDGTSARVLQFRSECGLGDSWLNSQHNGDDLDIWIASHNFELD